MSASALEQEEVEPEVDREVTEDDDAEITEEDAAAEPEQEDDVTAEPEQVLVPAAQTEKEIEKRNDALDREATRHANRVTEILGEDSLALIQCEACPPRIPGWHYPAGDYPPEDPMRVLYELLSGGTEAQMKHPARYVICDYCNGFGRVITGSKAESHRTLACPSCSELGYLDAEQNRPATPTTPLPLSVVENFVPAQAPEPERDFLGRPIGHPNYGMMSTYLSPEQQALDQRDGFGV